MMTKNISAIILAAGKGKRLKEFTGNKVLIPLFGKPLIYYPVEKLLKLYVKIYVVVGFLREDVKVALGQKVTYVVQREQLGTGHAVSCALPKLSKMTSEVLVMMGDHAFCLTTKNIKELLQVHKIQGSSVTILTVTTSETSGYGLVKRDKNNQIMQIVDGKLDKHQTKDVGEIIPGVYCFKYSFLDKYLSQLPRHTRSGEYYISDMIELAYKNKEKITSIHLRNQQLAVGINTSGDLKKAEKLLKKI